MKVLTIVKWIFRQHILHGFKPQCVAVLFSSTIQYKSVWYTKHIYIRLTEASKSSKTCTNTSAYCLKLHSFSKLSSVLHCSKLLDKISSFSLQELIKNCVLSIWNWHVRQKTGKHYITLFSNLFGLVYEYLYLWGTGM